MKRKILIIAIVALVLGGVFYIVKKMLTAENLYTFNISKTDGLKRCKKKLPICKK